MSESAKFTVANRTPAKQGDQKVGKAMPPSPSGGGERASFVKRGRVAGNSMAGSKKGSAPVSGGSKGRTAHPKVP
jgi:hypothetical protein